MQFGGHGLAAVLALGVPAGADQRYVVSGNDTYQIGQCDLQRASHTAAFRRSPSAQDGGTRFTAQATYTRADAAGSVPAQATFVQMMSAAGELHDNTNLDPDYLTVLNQPFAIDLDSATLHDLLHLRGRVPFVFPAPMTGGTLRGLLGARRHGRRVNDVPRSASISTRRGPMAGPLPDHAEMSISGTMRMRGTAYYALHGEPLLLALTESLTISGTLRDRGRLRR